ncbi:alkaline phosphatase [Collimonas sp. OK412]|jgi:alkaline phosphatase D|uniref:alkaline phosphatase D family protein n=1 Tax=Collimonas sp. (strain OK412) TaxID=1801619 RepID=UPI0008E05D7D|nr:alkaline phosphatase D family protein [Collimonas sp. OK412]SFC16410.1 alkaline phosphatase D [Collimonas sp. OK412]
MKRRQFLKGSAFFTVVAASTGLLSACGGSNSSSDGGIGEFAFPQGIASGDPKDSSAVFWARVVRNNGAAAAIAVRLEVSATPDFSSLAAQADLSATPDYDFTVRAKVTQLKPNTVYYYRFTAGSDVSPVAQTKTAPLASASNSQVRFAWFTCQDWSVNHWQAMSLLAQEDLDFVVHVGDYIYETVGASFQTGGAEPAHKPITLPNGLPHPGGGVYANTVSDYRTLYRTYKTDARLQSIHHKFPVIAIWDDHEFSDDCWQDHQVYTNQNKQETARRRSATQAWAEYTPIDFGDLSFDLNNSSYQNIRIYRDFRFGQLVHLVMTDERLYRDDHIVSEQSVAQQAGHDPVNGDDSIGARYFVPQSTLLQMEAQETARLGRPPSILGVTQTQWWKDTLKNSDATWKVWGNEIMLNRMWADLSPPALGIPAPYNQLYVINCDSWDGYPSHKAELLSYLNTQNIKNVVAITGDLHAFQCGVVRANPADPASAPVLVDFLAAGISSQSFYNYIKSGAATVNPLLGALTQTPQIFDSLLKGFNPDFAYVDHDAQGYASATVTSDSIVVVFNKVKPLAAGNSAPQQPLLKRTRITLAKGSAVPQVEDNV